MKLSMSGALTPGCENIDVESAILEGSIEGRSAKVLDKFIVILYRICKGKYIPGPSLLKLKEVPVLITFTRFYALKEFSPSNLKITLHNHEFNQSTNVQVN